MNLSTEFTRSLAITHPIIQAPLAGGGDTPELVAAVSNAGGLGFIGAAYLSPEQIRDAAAEVQRRTTAPFGINLFAPQKTSATGTHVSAAMLERLSAYCAELQIPAQPIPKPPEDIFPKQLEAALETGARCFSFTTGILDEDVIATIKARGMFLMGTATNVEEALALERAGVDAVVTQSSEAGGHRGTFSGDFTKGMIGAISLVPQVVDAVRVPVIASGGIMDGRGIVAALALGASAVQMGTAFLTCNEAGISEAYKQAILTAREDETRLTRAFSGRPARGIVNRFMTEVDAMGDSEIPDFPVQNALTRPIRTASAKQGRAEFLSLWAGQGVRMARRQSAAELVAKLVGEAKDVITRLQSNNLVLR